MSSYNFAPIFQTLNGTQRTYFFNNGGDNSEIVEHSQDATLKGVSPESVTNWILTGYSIGISE